MNEFHDPEIERMLGRSGGPFPDVNVALERVQGRVRQAKRRRAVVLTSTACALLVAGAVFAVGRSQGTADVGPANTGSRNSELRPDESFEADETTDVATTVTVATTETTAVTTTEATVPVATLPVVEPVTAPGNTNAPHNSTTPTTPHTTPRTVPPTAPPTTPTPTEPPATTAPPANTTTLSGVGGSITVRLQNGSLTMVSSHAANGFTVEVIQSSGNRVEVRFTSASHRTKLRVDLKNGAMYSRTPEEESF